MTTDNPFRSTWTEAEFAEQAGISTRTAKRWRDQRKGPPWIRLGKKILYRRAAVADWLLANEKEQPRGPARGR
jgi:predicted site-specific integrase-resolvase